MIFVALLAVCQSSCEDRALMEKRDFQRKEINLLKEQIQEMEVKIARLPPDATDALALVEKELEELESEASRLRQEISHLGERKSAIDREFEEYRAKYPIE